MSMFEVTGTHRSTGEPARFILESVSEQDAAIKAGQMGLSIRTLGPYAPPVVTKEVVSSGVSNGIVNVICLLLLGLLGAGAIWMFCAWLVNSR
jgi:hypothetical protein